MNRPAIAPTCADAAPGATTEPFERVRWAVADGVVVARRNLAHVRRVPEQLLDVTLQPIIFVLMFSYIFGRSILLPGGGDYVEYMMVGIFVQTMAFTGAGTAVGMADDVEKGAIDRFRVLPMARSGVLVGRTIADLATISVALAVLTVSGLVVGWRVHGGLGEVVAGYALLLGFGYAISWAGTLAGLLVRGAEAAQGIVFMALFPLTFVANTFVAREGLPGWLRPFADWNPVSSVVTAVRELFGNGLAASDDVPWPLAHPVPTALAWSLGLVVVCSTLATRRFRRIA